MNARPTHCPGPRVGELAPAWSLDFRSANRCTAPLRALPNWNLAPTSSRS